MLRIIKAEYVTGYMINVFFSNGENGIVDLTDVLWGPVFKPLRDMDMFRRFQVSPVLHTICWENDADIAPEYLYERMLVHTTADNETPAKK